MTDGVIEAERFKEDFEVLILKKRGVKKILKKSSHRERCGLAPKKKTPKKNVRSLRRRTVMAVTSARGHSGIFLVDMSTSGAQKKKERKKTLCNGMCQGHGWFP